MFVHSEKKTDSTDKNYKKFRKESNSESCYLILFDYVIF